MSSEENKKKNWFVRHKALTGIIVILILIVAVSAGGSDSSTNTNGSTKTESKVEAPKVVKLNEPARDGKFEFVVKSLECGKTSVGSNQYLTKNAQGQFCLLSVTIKNIGNEPQSLFSSNQKLLNAQNQQYATDDTATLYQAPDGGAWYNNINPGNSVEGTIVFDIPKDQTPTSAELHDSAYSNGVKISLQ